MSTMELQVRGMTCGGCEASVRNAVGRLAGVSTVEADHESGRVLVRYDAAVAIDDVCGAITAAGFEVVAR